VTVAGDGRVALNELEKASFDVILMDVQMPNMDGFETTATIREQEKSAGGHVPIVAMTAHALKGDQERCRYGCVRLAAYPYHGTLHNDRDDRALLSRYSEPFRSFPMKAWCLNPQFQSVKARKLALDKPRVNEHKLRPGYLGNLGEAAFWTRKRRVCPSFGVRLLAVASPTPTCACFISKFK
jgi:CheY-like chemotaxis protein